MDLLVFQDERCFDLSGHIGSQQLLHDDHGELEGGAWTSARDQMSVFLNTGL